MPIVYSVPQFRVRLWFETFRKTIKSCLNTASCLCSAFHKLRVTNWTSCQLLQQQLSQVWCCQYHLLQRPKITSITVKRKRLHTFKFTLRFTSNVLSAYAPSIHTHTYIYKKSLEDPWRDILTTYLSLKDYSFKNLILLLCSVIQCSMLNAVMEHFIYLFSKMLCNADRSLQLITAVTIYKTKQCCL